MVLVHGAAEDGRTWRLQLADLADDFTVVAWDEPGPGRSCDLPEGMTLAGFADGLAALIESLRLEPAHVAGLSWGGTIALELYRRHPALVATLIATQRHDAAGFLSATEYSGSFDALASVSSDIDADDLAEAMDNAGFVDLGRT